MNIHIRPRDVLPRASLANRAIANASTEHCTAFAVFGEGEGIATQAESWTELRNLYLLNARRDVTELREQVRFDYGPDEGDHHYFDAVTRLRDGTRVAHTVKPERGLESGHFLDEMQVIAWHVRRLGFADRTVLVTELDFDPVDLHNARMMAAVRAAVPEADAAAQALARTLAGARALRDLTADLGLGQPGYRALLRLVRQGVLEPARRERITPKTLLQRPARFN